MAIRRVTIGRSPYSDIQLDSRHIYASKHHGELYCDGNQMIYHDCSTNGTLINRKWVCHRWLPVRRGDIILVASRYLIDWNRLDAFLPVSYAQVAANGQPHAPSLHDVRSQAGRFSWNWGAMGLYPLWGLCNGCWWALPIGIALGWLFPLPNVVFGFFGNSWALQYGQWGSAQQFLKVQSQWKGPGIAAACAMSALFVWWVWYFAHIFLK